MSLDLIKNADIISVDIETYDPHLGKAGGLMGPGEYRRDGYILGIGIATDTGFRKYYNLGHYDSNKQERNAHIETLKWILGLPITKIGANIGYDVGWIRNWDGSKIDNVPKFMLEWEGIPVEGMWYDIQIAEPLIDENQKHNSLDHLAKKYLGYGKVAEKPIQFCIDNNLPYTGGHDFREWLYKMPFKLVEDYVLGDVDEPIKIFEFQKLILEETECWDLFLLECRMLRPMQLMRKNGVLIDTDRRDRNALALTSYKEERENALFKEFGEFNLNSTQQVARIFNKLGIEVPRKPPTDKMKAKGIKVGNQTIDQDYLKRLASENEWIDKILWAKKSGIVINNFLLGSYEKFLCEGDLLHCSFYNTRLEQIGGMNGTRSGRLSSAKPNLQQIPSPDVDTYLGHMAREPFIPFPGMRWMKIDYSQIEYRFTAHFAIGEGSDAVRAKYNSDPNTDYHQIIIDLTGLKRRFAKNLNFGVAYGMGAPHMAEYFQWELQYCKDILAIYHTKAPYIRATSDKVQQIAKRRGYIKTILNRRSHLVEKKKAYTMFCRLIQGSAADQMKQAMVDTYEAGIYDVLPLHLTVHDELDTSVPVTMEAVEAVLELQHIMENCIKIKVPVIADIEFGQCWAHKKKPEDRKPATLLKALQDPKFGFEEEK